MKKMPKRTSIILGVSFGHGDSSAALIVDGCLIAAAEEERFCRVKHYAYFPYQAIQYCLNHAKLSASEIDVLAIARKPTNLLTERLKLAWKNPRLIQERLMKKREANASEKLAQALKKSGLKRARVIRVEHHLAHLFTARILSSSDKISLLSFDGMGDFVSASMGRPTEEGIEILDRVTFPHSLGYFYTAMTQFMGFPNFGDEFKLMGLSSYGKPKYLAPLREVIRENESSFGYRLNLEAFPILKNPGTFHIEKGQPKVLPKFNANLLTQLIGIPPRKPNDPITEAHWDLAKSVQIRFEEVANHLLKQLYDKVPSDTLGLAGGCAHNSVWVGKIPQVSPFKKILVAPASHDAGIAVGAASAVAKGAVRPEGRHWALLGPSHTELGSSNTRRLVDTKEHHFPSEEKLIAWIVEELCQKKIIGLFHGRMEFGPRALGSRSILADPRWAGMQDKLNARVKHRESFRPFAASVLWELQNDWFKDSFFCPSMEAVFEVKQSEKIRAVTHVDGTCRIQSVTKETQPFYYALIQEFFKRTGIPLLLNTSFNDSEPIVCHENDVWNCFSHTELDAIVIGNRAYTKVAQNLALTG